MGAWVPDEKRRGLIGFSTRKYVCFGLWRHGSEVNLTPLSIHVHSERPWLRTHRDPEGNADPDQRNQRLQHRRSCRLWRCCVQPHTPFLLLSPTVPGLVRRSNVHLRGQKASSAATAFGQKRPSTFELSRPAKRVRLE